LDSKFPTSSFPTCLDSKFPTFLDSLSNLFYTFLTSSVFFWPCLYQGKKDIVFRFIIEYSSLRDFYRPLLGNK
jgi:hypothetical protein